MSTPDGGAPADASTSRVPSRREFLKGSAVAGAALGAGVPLAGGAHAASTSPSGGTAPGRDLPNVIVITTDQQRADVSAREGFGVDTTPVADQLAADGVWFNRAYTTSPLCCPARASLLTGRYPSAHRVRENPAVGEAVFQTDLPTLLHDSGYTTALIGKNHSYLGPQDLDYYRPYSHTGAEHDDTTPRQRQFDQWLFDLRFDTYTNPTPFAAELQCPHRIVSDAIEWIDSVSGRPFFLWLSVPEPHNPYQVPEPYFSLFPPAELPPPRHGPEVLGQLPFAWRYLRHLGEAGDPDYAASMSRARANYCGMLRLIDDQLHRFVRFLEDSGLREQTLLIATSDHGDYMGEYGLVRKGAGVPELLTRVPLLISGPGIAGHNGAHPAHVSLADLFPTVCEAIGTALPEGVQGRSLWPLLTGRDYPSEEFASAYTEQGMGGLPYQPHDVPRPLPGLGGPDDSFNFDELNAVTQSGQRRMVRSADWKLVVDNFGTTWLYHLPSDPDELHDLSEIPEHAGQHARLMRELTTWMLRSEDPLPIPPEGYPRKFDPRNYLAPYQPGRRVTP